MKILCIDDDLIMLESLKDELKNKYKNSKIEIVDNFNDVMMCAYFYKKQELKFDVIICNLIMPKIKGDSILKHLHEMFPNGVKILLYEDANEELFEYLKKQIENLYFIKKPINFEELTSSINDGITESLNIFEQKNILSYKKN